MGKDDSESRQLPIGMTVKMLISKSTSTLQSSPPLAETRCDNNKFRKQVLVVVSLCLLKVGRNLLRNGPQVTGDSRS